MLYQLGYWLSKLMCLVLGWRRTYGKENFIPGPALVACNHQSFLDPPIVGSAAPEKIAYMARRSLAKGEFMETFYAKLNCTMVSPDEPELSTFKKILVRLRNNEKVLLFPEGTRSYDGELQPAKAGIGFLVAKSGVPVIPAYIYGSYGMLPRGQGYVRPHQLIVAFGKPLYFDDILKQHPKKEAYTIISDTVMQEIANLKELCYSKL